MGQRIAAVPVQKIVATSDLVRECYAICLLRNANYQSWTSDLDCTLDYIYKVMPEASYRFNVAQETIFIYRPDFGLRPCGFIVDRLVSFQGANAGWVPIPLVTPLPRYRSASPVKHFTVTFTAWPNDDIDRILDSLSVGERNVLDLIVQGHSNILIGKMLGISEFTVRKHVHDLALKSRVDPRDPQIELVKKFCRLVRRVERNDQACGRWESWGKKNMRKESLLGWLNGRSTPEVAAAVDRKQGTVLRYLSDMNDEKESNEPRRARLGWVVWAIANFLPAIKRMQIVSIELEAWLPRAHVPPPRMSLSMGPDRRLSAPPA
jgi:hypothetical protein